MTNLSENYNLRLHYLQQDQVPTQSMIIKHMSPPLAGIFFQSLNPKLQELVGLQPLLKGGGADWIVDPAELLKGRTVLKPITRQVIKQLNHKGIEKFGHALYQEYLKRLERERAETLADADDNWIAFLRKMFHQMEEKLSDEEQHEITKKLINARNDFEYFYRMSFNKFETLFNEASITAIDKSKDDAMELMNNKLMVALKTQATILYDEYEEKFNTKKAKLKEEFVQQVEIERCNMGNKIHDVKVDKHACANLIKQFLHGRNLACQVYIALKEREAGLRQREELRIKHRKQIRKMEEKIEIKDNEISAVRQEEEMLQHSIITWQKKICKFVKSFQTFVSYSLKTAPEYAKFFINLEKLLLLQVNEVLEDPSVESIFAEEEMFHTPVPPLKPFYLFCDKGYKAQLHEDLCPKHSGTSSNTSQLPAIIINKQCLYAACDNFEQFTRKIKDYIEGKRGDEADFRDDLVYENFVPLKPSTSSEQLAELQELQFESSFLQILQKAKIENLTEKCFCPVNECMCVPPVNSAIEQIETISKTKPPSVSTSQKKQISEDLSKQIDHIHKYKWESYFDYKEPKSCICPKSIMRRVGNRLPAYMRRAKYPTPNCIPNYEMCSVVKLKELVQDARTESPVVEENSVSSSKTKNISTKCSDLSFQNACTCFETLVERGDSLDPKLFVPVQDSSRVLLDSNISPSYMTQPIEFFALDRAFSMKNILDDIPDLQEYEEVINSLE